MNRLRPLIGLVISFLLVLSSGVAGALAKPAASPTSTVLVSGLDGADGSTIGPDGALYVTEGIAGRVSRVDPQSGAITTFASGLPTRALAASASVGRSTLRSSAPRPMSSSPLSGLMLAVMTSSASIGSTVRISSRSSRTSVPSPSRIRRIPISSSRPASSTRWKPTAVAFWSLTGTTIVCCRSPAMVRSML